MTKNIDPDDPLAGIEEPAHPLLSAAEIKAAKDAAAKKIKDRQKAQALAKIQEEEELRLGVLTGDRAMDEEVSIFIDLPEHADRLTIDGRIFMHGTTHKVPRHMANSMREMMSRAQDHEADVKGESLRQKLGRHRIANFDKIEGQRVSA